MPLEEWTRWPPREGTSRDRESTPRRVISVVTRIVVLTVMIWGTYAHGRFGFWEGAAVAAEILAAVALTVALLRSTRGQRLGPAMAATAGLLAVGALAEWQHATPLSDIVFLGLGVTVLVRLPLGPAVLAAAAAFGTYTVVGWGGWLATAPTVGGLMLLGYLLRLDAGARATAHRLLVQERAAHKAEAESAALAERARIAREIHDVLAHSLSAQLVHLEAARLMLDTGAEREAVRERVVAARRMAQDGLAETRQALSALRGEFTPVGEYLVELTGQAGAELIVWGTARPLAAEAALAVRRTTQEALTNVRKHAPGSRVTVRLGYLEDGVELEVRNGRPPRGAGSGELAVSGSGYGLLGMRERAELLGGELLAGPEDGGWRVLLRVPA
ncbi:sensor histidine kinase [Kitasatospora sp. HPMI-4]|uniref:sensor histidine kinase n=1 Tax=Kitasatospora sp. HPMI-4 TaxID=3448443 RepID=UPI003F1A8FE1